MTRIAPLLFAALFGLHTIATAAPESCPADASAAAPWTNNGAVKGDEWAWTYLVLDSHGWPTQCLMGENDIDDSDRRFFVCKYMKEHWRPAKEASARQASATVKQFFFVPGPDHRKALNEARLRYLADHPDVRPECFAD
jgi:hypothetical protein